MKLNRRAYEHARGLIEQRKFVLDDRDAWSEYFDVENAFAHDARGAAQRDGELIEACATGRLAEPGAPPQRTACAASPGG